MVSIGTLQWTVKVDNASEAKEQAKQVEEKVNDAKKAAEGADEATQEYSDDMGKLAETKEKVGSVTDKLNAKFGFLTSAIWGTITTLLSLVGGFAALKAVLVGGAIAAGLVALAIAFKNNFADIRDRVSGFVDWLKGAFQGAKDTVLSIWNSFKDGFGGGGGSLKDFEEVVDAVLDGVTEALQNLRGFIKPILKALGKAFKSIAKVIGKVVGKIVNILAKLEDKFGFVSKAVEIIGTFIGAFLAVAGVITVLVKLAGVIGTVISVIGGIIAAINPVTVAIAAIIAIIAVLYLAWKENFLGIQDIVDDVIGFLKSVFGDLVSSVQDNIAKIVSVFDRHLKPLIGDIKDLFNQLIPIIVPILKFLKKSVMRSFGALVEVAKSILKPLAGFFRGLWGIVSTIVAGALDAILSTVRIVLNLLTGDWKEAFNILKDFLGRSLDRMVSIFEDFVVMVGNAVMLIINAIIAPFRYLYEYLVGNSLIPDVLEGIKDAFNGAVDMISNAVSSVVDTIISPFTEAKDRLLEMFDGIGDAIAGGLKSAFNAIIPDKLKLPEITIGGGSIAGQDIPEKEIFKGATIDLPQLDTGGYVEESGIAQIHRGETVVPAEVTKNFESQSTEGGINSEPQPIEININGIEIGDQSIDLSNMTRREIKMLAEEIADVLGKEVRNTIQ